MNGIELCTDYHFLEALRIIKYIIFVLKIVIPIIILVMGSYDFFKVVMDDRQMKEKAKLFGVRIAAALFIFMAPTFVKILFSLMGNYSSLAGIISTCDANATSENIKLLKNTALANAKDGLIQEQEYQATYEVSRYVLSKASSTSGSASEDYYNVIMTFEGNTGYCDDAKTQYKAVDIGDGVATAGFGVTSYSYPALTVGECYDVELIDDLFMQEADARNAEVDQLVSNLGITDWDDAKTTAAVSIGYNCGSSYTQKVIKNYKASGNDGALAAFKSCVNASNGNPIFTEGLKQRRDKEYDIFINGNYSVLDENRANSANRKYVP